MRARKLGEEGGIEIGERDREREVCVGESIEYRGRCDEWVSNVIEIMKREGRIIRREVSR